ncbi:hypothetical protein ACJMK2_003941 [Sinanodonta woodiana]|uniref:Uncharacterized protein n=1 Tax=Sinanodonta woodiana TaxID=1069815 RepID=A0ABD3Y1F7_SINWO
MRLFLIAALVCVNVALVMSQLCSTVHDCTLSCWAHQTVKCEHHICTCEHLHNTGSACLVTADCQGTNNPEPLRCNDHQIHCVNHECHCAHHGHNHFE